MNTMGRPGATPGRLVLVRHGETADNVAGRFLGRSDPALTDRGRQSARSLSDFAARWDGATVVSSPARRAIETARCLGPSDPIVDADLREIDFGDWEGCTPDEVAARDPEGFAAFDRGDIAGFPGGESVIDVRDRVVAAVGRHAVPSLVAVTHATVIRILVSALLGLPVERYRSVLGRPGHLSWTELDRHSDGWRLVSYSTTAVSGVADGAGMTRP